MHAVGCIKLIAIRLYNLRIITTPAPRISQWSVKSCEPMEYQLADRAYSLALDQLALTEIAVLCTVQRGSVIFGIAPRARRSQSFVDRCIIQLDQAINRSMLLEARSRREREREREKGVCPRFYTTIISELGISEAQACAFLFKNSWTILRGQKKQDRAQDALVSGAKEDPLALFRFRHLRVSIARIRDCIRAFIMACTVVLMTVPNWCDAWSYRVAQTWRIREG